MNEFETDPSERKDLDSDRADLLAEIEAQEPELLTPLDPAPAADMD